MCDFRSRAETGVNQSQRLQPVQRRLIKGGPLKLNDRFAIDGQPEPVEVFENRLDKFRPAPGGIEILDPDPELTAAGSRALMADDRRIGMAEMKPAGRRGGETCDLQDSLHGKGDRGTT